MVPFLLVEYVFPKVRAESELVVHVLLAQSLTRAVEPCITYTTKMTIMLEFVVDLVVSWIRP